MTITVIYAPKTNNTIYLDMDGVLADFDHAAHEILGPTYQAAQQEISQQRPYWPKEQWDQLRTVPDLYFMLPKTALADDLVTVARKLRDQAGWDLGILTAIPKANDMHSVFDDKFRWKHQYYPDIPLFFGPYSEDKHLHVKLPGDILVDDRVSNCQQWLDAGGHAIRVLPTNHADVLAQLEKILETELGK